MGGGAKPAVRVELNPMVLEQLWHRLGQVRTALNAANANRPKGILSDGNTTLTIDATDQLKSAAQYQPLIVAYQNGAPVRLGDVATVLDRSGRPPQRGPRERQAGRPDHHLPRSPTPT